MKFKSLHFLIEVINKQRKKNIGFTNGCFDLLHEGHIYNLNKCKSNCDILIVAINSNISVKKIKGPTRPIETLNKRIKKVSNLKCVDYVVYFHKASPINIIKLIKPDVLFKGEEYKNDKIIGQEVIERHNGKVVFIPHLKGYSTTNKIKRLYSKN